MDAFLNCYLLTANALAAATLAVLLLNLATFRRLRGAGARPTGAAPRVSVLVPARNEELNIRACAESLLTQDYPNCQLIILDDQSTDATPGILKELAAQHPRLRVITGQTLPPGWLGKCWACQLLGEAADGDWLLFTDADTVHEPQSVSAALAHAQRTDADLLSAWPFQETGSWSELLVVPIVMHVLLLSFAPLALIKRLHLHRIGMACGQFMLWRRAAYRRIGGHECVRDWVLEDVQLGRVVLRNRMRLELADATLLVRTRMYRSFPQLWEGFSKNLFAVAGGTWLTLAGALFATTGLLVLPWFLAPLLSVLGHPLAPWAWTVVLLTFVRRLVLALRFRTPILSAILHPVGSLLSTTMTLNSAWRCWTGRGINWKARAFQPQVK
ncbi:MAG: glycosyltransferase [Verrucomicrobia bacterium]|nr:glycosyltransferase [Verrucomicrobiota bacterium]